MNNSERKSVFSDMETPKKSGERQEKPASRNVAVNSVKSWTRAGVFGLTLGLGILGVADNASAFETNVENISRLELKKAVSENDVMAIMQLLLEDLGYEYAGDDHKDGSVIEIVLQSTDPLKKILMEGGKKVKAILRKKGKKGKVKFKVRFAEEGGNITAVIHGQTELDKAKMEGENDVMRMMELLIAELGYERIGNQSDMSVIEIVQEKDGEKPENTLKRGGKNVRKALIEKKMREDGMIVMPGDWKAYKLEEGVEYKATHAWVNGKLMAAIWGKIKPKSNRRGPRGVKGESMDGNIDFDDTVTAKTRRQALWKAAKKKEMSVKDFKKKFQIKKSNKKGIWAIERISVQVAQNETRAKKEIPPQSKAPDPDTQKELPKAQSPIKKMTPSMKKKLNPKFKSAYNSTLKRHPDFRGKLNIFISINEKGRVTKLEVEGKGEAHKDFKITLMKKIKNLRFPSDENPMRIEIPYDITPSNY